MTKPSVVVSVPNGTPRRPTKEECFDQFELVARQIFREMEAEQLRDEEVHLAGVLLTDEIKLTASLVKDYLVDLRNLVEEAKGSNVWQVLGFPSWTAYLADTLADEPMRLGRDERQELVGYLSGEGLSVRAIAPIVGADNKTVHRDIAAVANAAPDDAPKSGDYETTTVTGLDGKAYARPSVPYEEWLTPEQVCAVVPGMTTTLLSRRRDEGKAPRYFKPSPKTVVYARSDIDDWVRSTAVNPTRG